MHFDFVRTTELTRRSVLHALAVGLASLGLHGSAIARTALQRRQCRQPSRLKGVSPPYILRLLYPDGDELLFVAARHSVDMNSPTHALIRHMLTTMTPERAIVEGYYDDPARLLPEDLGLFSRNIYPEDRYALALAEERGIRAIGGDLDPSEIAHASVSHGFQREDVIGTHVVRMLAGQVSNVGPEAVVARVKQNLSGLFPAGGFDFEDWYARRVGEPLSNSSVRRTYRGPCGSGIIAEIASFESETRNQHLLAIIATARRDAARVGAVFGANHLYATFGALADGAVHVDIVTPADLPNDSPPSALHER